jgi:dTDP-4-dehydrorhamnose 3,5-epimerase
VTSGRVFDVAVDIRRSSPRFGKWIGIELSDENHRQLWIPPGFAHGYLVLSEFTDFLYKTTNFYFPPSEGAVRWDDAAVGIAWPDLGLAPQLSEKDLAAPLLSAALLMT